MILTLAVEIGTSIAFRLRELFSGADDRRARAGAGGAATLSEALRRNFPDVAIVDFQPTSEQVRRAAADQKMNADLAGGFGLFGTGSAQLGSLATGGVAPFT